VTVTFGSDSCSVCCAQTLAAVVAITNPAMASIALSAAHLRRAG
jgi:hypothetical protein